MKLAKSRLVVLVTLICLLALVGCGPKVPPDQPGDQTAQMDPSPAPPTAEPEIVEVTEEPAWVEPEMDPAEKLSELEAKVKDWNDQGILGDIFFSFDKSDLSEESRRRLDAHARWLQAHPELGLLVEGHCDERGTEEYNLALGDRRSNAALEYLIQLGIPNVKLQSISYGEERPAKRGHNETAWAKNRRGHFVVQMMEAPVGARLD